jgi:probable addiction module antidote protein
MAMTKTSRYDVAEHLRTSEEMAAYLEACLEVADGDAAFVAKALGDIRTRQGHDRSRPGCGPIPREPLQGPFRRPHSQLRDDPEEAPVAK